MRVSFMNTPCIEFSNVSYRYGGVLALEDISFTVQDGDYVGLVGPNGAGKTTLLKLLLGILKPDAGQITIGGADIRGRRHGHALGYVPQHAARGDNDFPATVEEIVMSGRAPRRGLRFGYSATDRRMVEEALEVTGMGELRHRRIGELSGGERQRAMIARALAGESRILILDEPTVGVDLKQKERFYDFLATLNKKRGLTIIVVSHDVDAVAKEVSYVLCLNRRLECHVTSAEFIKEDYVGRLYGGKARRIAHNHKE